MKIWALFFCLVLLAACGTAANGPIVSAVKTKVMQLGTQRTPGPDLQTQKQAVLADVVASRSKEPVLLVELPSLNAVASLVIAGQNQGTITWMDPSGVAISTEAGIVISTRGLGDDLMSVDRARVLTGLKAGQGSHRRVHRYLDGEGQPYDLVFQCEVRRLRQTTLESCAGQKDSFENHFVIKNNDVTKSVQWLGHNIGYAHIERLN